MATDWSDSIVIAELSDEPLLSEELAAILQRLVHPPEGGAKAPVPHVVLNFAGVTYVNSSNLSQLLRLQKVLSQGGRTLKLCSVSDEVWSVMMVTGLDKHFRFAPDPMTALAGLQIEDEGKPR